MAFEDSDRRQACHSPTSFLLRRSCSSQQLHAERYAFVIHKAEQYGIDQACTDRGANTKKDGETSQWTNAGSGNSVRIDAAMTPGARPHAEKKTRQHIAVMLSAKGQSMNLHQLVCGTGKTDWSLQKR